MDIKINHISKSYAGKKVLDDVSLNIPEKKITCIMGPSGNGKTTLLHVLMGLVKADSGIITGIEGKTVSAVFQEDRLCESFDAITNIRMAGNGKISKEQIIEELEKVDLKDYEGKSVSKLSGGMKRRVAILRCVLKDADVYIMDEPFKGFDDQLKQQVIRYVKEKLKNKTVIIVTHDKTEVNMLSAVLYTFHTPTFVL